MADASPLAVVIQGAKEPRQVRGFEIIPTDVEIRFAPDLDALEKALPGARVLFGWNFRGGDLPQAWHAADSLEWIQWSGAGVDGAMFDDLKNSNVLLTNARGIFDRPMAEYALGLMIAHAKKFSTAHDQQRENRWRHLYSTRMEGQRVLIVGVGAIGRAMARLFRAFGLVVEGVGRTARTDDSDFARIHAVSDLIATLPGFDYVIMMAPFTPETENLFSDAAFDAMSEKAQFINFGRGQQVDEPALIRALEGEKIAAAAVDVVCNEPLPPEDPLWLAPNLIITPHSSGDYHTYLHDVTALFVKNLEKFRAGEPLINVVDKQAGFVTAPLS
ncbi:MAG: D-2-hydroxyacid dehydrogenase [Rhodospirillales bacterium]